MTWRALTIVFLITLYPLQAFAVKPDEVLADKKLEERARTLSSGLRCLVCQNQSIDDSDAPLARDLRILVRERLKAGDSDRQVLDFLIARYGSYILLKPPLNIATLLLWSLPFVLLLLAAPFIFFRIRRRSRIAEETSLLDADEESRVEEILGRRSQ